MRGHSGAGSYGHLARFKADTINSFVRDQQIHSVIEFGCGDGNQLALADYPSYIGLDVAASALDHCIPRFASDSTKSFFLYDPRRWHNNRALVADLAISLDVIYHLVEDDIYDRYMHHLFEAALRFVIIYSSNHDKPHRDKYMRHHRFTDWIEAQRPEWRTVATVPNRFPFDPAFPNSTSYSDFWIFAAP